MNAYYGNSKQNFIEFKITTSLIITYGEINIFNLLLLGFKFKFRLIKKKKDF